MRIGKLVASICAVAIGFAIAAGGAPGPDQYPAFSWKTVPLYMHIRKAAAFNPAELKFLGRFPLITLEKGTGNQSYGSVEKGSIEAARAIKGVNPSAKVLFYRNIIVHYGGYAANRDIDNVPGAFLVDGKGNRKLVRNRVEAYDLTNAAVRNWWVELCRRVAADPAIDGIFVDGNVKALEPDYLAREIGAQKKKSLVTAYERTMEDTRRAIGPRKLFIANLLRARFPDSGLASLRLFDGSYLEGIEAAVGMTREEYVAKEIAATQTAARQGKIIAFSIGLGNHTVQAPDRIDEAPGKAASPADANERLRYCLAMFLVCAEKHSYFLAHEGYGAESNDAWMRWFPEYDKPLGAPKGPAKQQQWTYTREFEHASVWLDIQNEKARIEWR
jgi:hypothetical protein